MIGSFALLVAYVSWFCCLENDQSFQSKIKLEGSKSPFCPQGQPKSAKNQSFFRSVCAICRYPVIFVA